MIRLDMKNYNTSEKTDKYESLTAELLLSYQSRIIEQPKFTYFSLGKTFEKKPQKQLKTNEKKKLKL